MNMSTWATLAFKLDEHETFKMEFLDFQFINYILKPFNFFQQQNYSKVFYCDRWTTHLSLYGLSWPVWHNRKSWTRPPSSSSVASSGPQFNAVQDIKRMQISIIILNEGSSLEESLFYLQPSKALKRTSEGLYWTKFFLHLNNSLNQPEGDSKREERVSKVLKLKWDLGFSGRETSYSMIWISLEVCITLQQIPLLLLHFLAVSVFVETPSRVYPCSEYASRSWINIHTHSEVKRGSEGVWREEKTFEIWVFRGPGSHYIGEW